MSETEALNELVALQDSSDPESAHTEADDIPCDLLRELGCDGVVDAFMKLEKWYA